MASSIQILQNCLKESLWVIIINMLFVFSINRWITVAKNVNTTGEISLLTIIINWELH